MGWLRGNRERGACGDVVALVWYAVQTEADKTLLMPHRPVAGPESFVPLGVFSVSHSISLRAVCRRVGRRVGGGGTAFHHAACHDRADRSWPSDAYQAKPRLRGGRELWYARCSSPRGYARYSNCNIVVGVWSKTRRSEVLVVTEHMLLSTTTTPESRVQACPGMTMREVLKRWALAVKCRMRGHCISART